MSRSLPLSVLVPTFLVFAASARAQFTNKVTTTPIVVQDNQGPAGDLLPYDGLEYCCPTAVTMSLSYLGVNGFNQIGPSSPTAADNLNLDRVLSGLMSTDPLAGTSSNADITNAIELYLAAKGIAASAYSLTSQGSPTIASLTALNQPGTVVDLVCGDYNTSNDRVFGHCVSLLAQGVNAQGQPAPKGLVINNPEPSAFAPMADVPANSPQYFNTTATSGNLTGDGAIELDPAQYPGFWGTDRLVVETALTLTVNPSQQSVNNPTVAAWTISSAQTINLHGGDLSVLAPIQGAGGISEGEGGVLELQAADSSTGTNTIAAATLRSDVASGLPFGSGSIQLQAGALQISPVAGSAAVNLTAAGGSGGAVTYADGSALALDRDGNASLTLTLGGNSDGTTPNLVRDSANHGTLVISPDGGVAALGGAEKLLVSGSASNLPVPVNGIVSPSIVAENNDSFGSGDFLNYGASGFVKAAYTQATSTSIAAAGSSAVYEANAAQNLAASSTAQVYALKVDAFTVGGGAGSDLEVGAQAAGQSGVILNGGTISTPSLSFGMAEGLVYSSNAGGTISAVIKGSGGLTTFGPGVLTLKAANAYTGGTVVNSGTLDAANSTGSITGGGAVTVQQNATLEISGSSGKAGGAGGTTVESGGALLLNGGTAAGPLTLNSGSHLFGNGTISGAAVVSGTIGGSADSPFNAPYSGVEKINFTGGSTTFNSQTIYSWRLNALTDTPAEAGTDWSELNFTNASGTNDMGTQGNAFNFSLDLGTGLDDPDSGDSFWNQSHQWVAADAPSGFNEIYFNYDFPTFSQGSFTLSTDVNFDYLYVDYTPVPEMKGGALFAFAAALLGFRRRRRAGGSVMG